MRILLAVAHPDDEALGCGGTVAALSSQGHEVHVVFMSGHVAARERRAADIELDADIVASQRILGISSVERGQFPNIQMNTVGHLELVQFIEAAIRRTGAEWIFTHHPHDLNDDHRQTSVAVQAAARVHQRDNGGRPLRGLAFMEIPSSTDWQFDGTSRPFEPNTFFEIGREGLDRKIEAVEAYRHVMRPFPHPRSEEVIAGLAAVRGGQSGLSYAEAFQLVHLNLTGLLR